MTEKSKPTKDVKDKEKKTKTTKDSKSKKEQKDKELKIKSYKFRIYPNKKQRILINKTFGCARLVYNLLLNDALEHYKEHKELKINSYAVYKPKYEFLKEVDCIALTCAKMNLTTAYKNFFKHNSRLPQFKSKNDQNKSYTTCNNPTRTAIRIENGRIRLPKVGFVKINLHREFVGKPTLVTVSCSPSGKYYVSFFSEQKIKHLKENNNTAYIRIDIENKGIILNDKFIKFPQMTEHMKEQIIYRQQILSNKQKGSRNRNKARIRLAKLYERTVNIREYFLHNLTTSIIRDYHTIILEDIKVSKLIKDKELGTEVKEALKEISFHRFKQMLEYKSDWYGRNLEVIEINEDTDEDVKTFQQRVKDETEEIVEKIKTLTF